MVMEVWILMLAVTACYTISSLSDKYAVSEAKFSGNEFTFLMCSSMFVFLACTLPFQTLYFSPSWQSFLAVGLISGCKMLEFQMSALVLKQLSAFELKAWLGVTLFVSYLTDVVGGAQLNGLKLMSIAITVLGLVFIAKSGRAGSIQYRSILIPLILYLTVKYGYGLVIKAFTPYVSPTMQLMPAMGILALISLTMIKPKELIQKNKKGVLVVILARIPNTAGMLIENAIIAISLANYSFVQPMILVSLFIIRVLKREKYTKLNFFGSMVCMLGVVLFQLL